MYAIVGLGNPGSKYQQTRHNVGARVVEELASSVTGQSPSWQEKFSCLFAKGSLGSETCLFILPQSYMNLSGEALAPLLKFYKIDIANLVVVHDELDLPPGVVRLKQGGGCGGHNGLEDIKRHLGANFYRVRVGIGHPRDLPEDRRGQDVSSWVLGVAKAKDRELIDKAIPEAGRAVSVLVEQGLLEAQQIIHGP